MSLLPGNLPALEHHLDDAENRLSTIDIQTETLWDALRCPVSVLPFLAWSVSVDVWNSDWPVALQRQVTAKSLELHQYKGTPKGVKLALSSLGLEYEYSEWWQENPRGQPGTFKITAFVNNNLASDNELLGVKNLSLIKRLIDNNKRGSAHYYLNLGLGVDGLLCQSGGVEPIRGDIDTVIDPPAIAADDVPGQLLLSGDTQINGNAELIIDGEPLAREAPGLLYLSGSLYQHMNVDINL